MLLPCKLAAIPGEDEELEGGAERLTRARKTAGHPRQASEIMPEFGVVRFHAVGLGLIGQADMLPRIVDHVLVGDPRIGVVLHRAGRGIHERLNRRLIAVNRNVPPQEAAGGPIHFRQQVDAVFLSSTNV